MPENDVGISPQTQPSQTFYVLFKKLAKNAKILEEIESDWTVFEFCVQNCQKCEDILEKQFIGRFSSFAPKTKLSNNRKIQKIWKKSKMVGRFLNFVYKIWQECEEVFEKTIFRTFFELCPENKIVETSKNAENLREIQSGRTVFQLCLQNKLEKQFPMRFLSFALKNCQKSEQLRKFERKSKWLDGFWILPSKLSIMVRIFRKTNFSRRFLSFVLQIQQNCQ